MQDREKFASTIACGLVVVLLIIGTRHHLPYGFYTLLRIIVCGTATYFTWRDWNVRIRTWPLAFAVVAILFNPVLPIRLSRSDWFLIDLAVAALFALGAVLGWRRSHPSLATSRTREEE